MTIEQVHTHPVPACVHAARMSLIEVTDFDPLYMSAEQKRDALRELAALQAQAAELEMRVLATASDVADECGARDASAWYAVEVHLDPSAARGDLELGKALQGYRRVAAGMRAGDVNHAQARAIVAALDALPADLDPEIRVKAEAHLVDLAKRFEPASLRRLGRRILEVVAPDIADAEDAKALEREEARAQERCSLRLRTQGDGTTRITGLVPDAVGARLATYLDAYTSPRQASGEALPRHRANGQAFCALLEHLDPAKLPDHGGDATTIIVTIDHTALTQRLGTADLLDGDQITATQARRLACTAKILPAVLGGKGEILDLGRARRLFSPAQRKALRLRDRHCRAEGCSIPATWCESHHRDPWSEGGKTDLADGVLLCSHHHHRAHDPAYRTETLPNGDHRYHRRN